MPGYPQNHVIEIIDAIAGLSCGSVSLAGNTTLSGRFMGWGPSLHRTGLRFEFAPSSLLDADIETALEPYLAVQRDRRDRASALGLGASEQPPATRLAHIDIDRLVARLATELTSTMREWPAHMRSKSMPASDEGVTHGTLHIRDGRDGDIRPKAVLATPMPWGAFDGERLVITGVLPETALNALIGRPVRDAIEIPRVSYAMDDLGDRTILEAEMAGGRVNLRVAPDWTHIPDIS